MLNSHRVHDYRFLIKRWRSVARAAGLRMAVFTELSGYPLYYLESRKAPPAEEWVYLSTGIHGDEPAGPEALIQWVENHPDDLRTAPFLIFPCLNPWGLINNRRVDETGLDLNRIFHRDELPFVQDWRRVMGARRCRLAMMLHEDYDAQGLYLYEMRAALPYWGEALLAAAQHLVPADERLRIEARKAQHGIIRPRRNRRFFERIGWPEAAYVFVHHARRTFTVETPSEYGLDRRVQAQIAILHAALQRAA